MLAGQRVLVTGGAGFVGSHLTEALLGAGAQVAVYDNGSTGQWQFLDGAYGTYSTKLRQFRGHLSDTELLCAAMAGCDLVIHLAANADIRHGIEYPDRDFEQNLGGTQTVLRTMHHLGIKRIAFASSGAVYGGHSGFAITEDCPFPIQNSFYGASKLAAESLISAYASMFDMRAYIFRFVPMLGERYSHGHIFDFVKKLRANPDHIEVLGSGQVRKYCVYVGDAMRAVLMGIQMETTPVNVFNIGNPSCYTIDEVVEWVAWDMQLTPGITYTGKRWVGDNPDMNLDASRMHTLGWWPQVSTREAVRRTVSYLLDNPWLLARES
jgi:UDP-glucose 4-epimerase